MTEKLEEADVPLLAAEAFANGNHGRDGYRDGFGSLVAPLGSWEKNNIRPKLGSHQTNRTRERERERES